MSESRLSNWLQSTSTMLAIGAALVYLFGFVIVSIFDATYGIVDFSLFRPRVIAVGLLFSILLAFPIIVVFRAFAIFGLTMEGLDSLARTVPQENRGYLALDIAMSSPLVCVGMAWTVVFLFTSGFDWTGIGFGIFILIVAIMAAIHVWMGKAVNKFPKISILITIIGSLGLFFDLFKSASRPFFWIVLWFSACCVYTVHFIYLLSKPDKARNAPWERFLLLLAPILFGGYAIHVYPHVRREFGGGATVPIVLHMSKKSSVFNTESAAVSLIDETEQGYYVVHGSDKAVFVKRDLVEEVEFLHSGPPQSPAKP